MLVTLLAPLSWIFSLGVLIRRALYHVGFFKSRSVDRPVLCVGNLTTGGTGKTPWVALITEKLSSNYPETVILSRGYSGDFSGVMTVNQDTDPRTCGDEPLWLFKKTKRPVYISRQRLAAAEKAKTERNVDLFVLDDGFQHWALKRDFDFILLDASVKKTHYRMLPWGRLREPFSALKRAQAVVFNKCNYASPQVIQELEKEVKRYVDDSRIFYADFEFHRWSLLWENTSGTSLHGPIALTCGVGNPDAFIKTVQDLGLEIGREFLYPDHHFWKPEDVEKITYQMRQRDLKNLVMTEKDAIKLVRYQKHFKELGLQMWVCEMQVKLHKKSEHLMEFILSHLQRKK